MEISIAISTPSSSIDPPPLPSSSSSFSFHRHLHHNPTATPNTLLLSPNRTFPLVQFQSRSPYISPSVQFLISSPTLLSFLPYLFACLSLILPLLCCPLSIITPCPYLSLSSHLSLHLYSRKKVAINKAAMSYRQEKSRKLSSLDCSMTEQSTLQQDERMAHSFMDAHGCNARSKTARNIWVLLRNCLEMKLPPS